MAKKEESYAPAYVERVLTPEELKRRAMIEGQTDKFNGMHNSTRLMLALTLFFSITSVCLWTILSDVRETTIGSVFFPLAFYAAFGAAALSLILGISGFFIAKGIKHSKVGMKTLSMALIAIVLVAVMAGYITEFFTAGFPSF